MKNEDKAVYKLSFRITHPSIDPHEITEALDLQPNTTQRVGEPRKTPKDNPLKGVYGRSYWYCQMGEGERLANLIDAANKRLSDKLPFLSQLVDTGGRLEYFIGCFVSSSYGDVLPWELLEQCVHLKIDLSFDIYEKSLSWF